VKSLALRVGRILVGFVSARLIPRHLCLRRVKSSQVDVLMGLFYRSIAIDHSKMVCVLYSNVEVQCSRRVFENMKCVTYLNILS